MRQARIGIDVGDTFTDAVAILGVAGGSMIRVKKGKITNVGPRSPYRRSAPMKFSRKNWKVPSWNLSPPLKDDEPALAVVRGGDGRKVSLTLAGAANLLKSVPITVGKSF